MKLVSYKDRAPGDILFIRNNSIESGFIVDFESEIHENYKGNFVPSHVAIEAYSGTIFEAVWNKLVAVAADTKYNLCPIQVWRLDRTSEQIEVALRTYAKQYGNAGYGILDLLGFAIEAFKRHLGNPKANNPIFAGYVCSMAALLFLRYDSGEKWPLVADMRDCDPLQLLMNCLDNATSVQ